MATTTKNQPTTVPNELSANTRSIRLYSMDDKTLIELHKTAKDLNRKIDIVDLIRDAVQAGLPMVSAKWEPLVRKDK